MIQQQITTTHQPQESSLAERINRTLLQTARSYLHHAAFLATFWDHGIKETNYKYNCILHESTNKSPYQRCHGQPPPPLLILGQLRTIPILKREHKLASASNAARYLYCIHSHKLNVFNLQTGSTQTIRKQDFHTYHTCTDPTASRAHAHLSKTGHHPPISITYAKPDRRNLQEARRYPDHPDWSVAHSSELAKLDNKATSKWVPIKRIRDTAKRTPIRMAYRYRRDTNNKITERKARAVLRGDLMIRFSQYDSNKKSASLADKLNIRLLLVRGAANHFHIKKFHITSPYIHEPYSDEHTFYIRQPRNFDGSLRHPVHHGILEGNLESTPVAAHIYLTALLKYLNPSTSKIPKPIHACSRNKPVLRAQL